MQAVDTRSKRESEQGSGGRGARGLAAPASAVCAAGRRRSRAAGAAALGSCGRQNGTAGTSGTGDTAKPKALHQAGWPEGGPTHLCAGALPSGLRRRLRQRLAVARGGGDGGGLGDGIAVPGSSRLQATPGRRAGRWAGRWAGRQGRRFREAASSPGRSAARGEQRAPPSPAGCRPPLVCAARGARAAAAAAVTSAIALAAALVLPEATAEAMASARALWSRRRRAAGAPARQPRRRRGGTGRQRGALRCMASEGMQGWHRALTQQALQAPPQQQWHRLKLSKRCQGRRAGGPAAHPAPPCPWPAGRLPAAAPAGQTPCRPSSSRTGPEEAWRRPARGSSSQTLRLPGSGGRQQAPIGALGAAEAAGG